MPLRQGQRMLRKYNFRNEQKIYLAVVFLLFFILAAGAEDLPFFKGYVTDQAGLISDGMKIKLENYLKDFENSESTQILS